VQDALLGFFLLLARFDEMDANLIAIDPSEFATPIGFSHGRQHQEKLLHGKPSTEPSIESLAPVSDASSIVQGRRQVPSITIMLAVNPFSNTTLCALRFSVMCCALQKKPPSVSVRRRLFKTRSIQQIQPEPV
jgi:hypothetical protein